MSVESTNIIHIYSPFTGTLHPITEAPDEAFAQKMTGDGFFVTPTDATAYAPCDSEVTFVFDTHHAMGLTAADGTEYLLHIGIDTVKLNGEGFTVYVTAGQQVKKGDRLLSFDLDVIRKKATSDACICLFTDLEDDQEVHLTAGPDIQAGEEAAVICTAIPDVHTFNSPVTGMIHPLAEAPDTYFSQKTTGDGFFVYPEEYTVYAPCDGDVFFIFEEQNAIGMHRSDGLEYMIQAGIGTEILGGQGFTFYVQDQQPVKKGDKLFSFDNALFQEHQLSNACFCIFTDLDPAVSVQLLHQGLVQAGQEVVRFE